MLAFVYSGKSVTNQYTGFTPRLHRTGNPFVGLFFYDLLRVFTSAMTGFCFNTDPIPG